MNQRSNCQLSLDHRQSKTILEKTSGTASWTKLKSWTVWKQLWNIIKGMRISDYLTCHLGNLCAGQEVKIRTLYGITNCFKIGKGV